MKIEVNSPTVNQLPVDRGPKQVANGGVVGAQGSTEDRTTLLTDSFSVQSLTSQALSSPEVRQARVDSVRQSVTSGEYQVNATKVAGAIIDNGDV